MMRQTDFLDEQDRADARALAAERTEQDAVQTAAIRARASAGLEEANRRFLLREFEIAGVEPPKRADGSPNLTCGLSLLLALGWTVQQAGRERVLVAPPPPEPWTGHRDRDSLPDEKRPDGKNSSTTGP